MKLKILCLSLALLLVFLPAQAAQTVAFGAIDYTVYPLTRSYMPIHTGGQWMIPHTLLTQTGLYTSYSPELRYLAVIAPGKTLTFNLPRHTAFDSQEQYSQYALRDGNIFYLPAEFVSSYFGYSLGVIETDDGSLVRIKTRSVSSDSQFASAVRDDLHAKAEEYNRTATTLPPTTAPQPSGAAITTPTPTPEPEPEPSVVYLTFDDGPTDASGSIQDVLDEYNIKATFFLLGTNIDRNRDMVRRVVGAGHAIGLHSYTHKQEEVYASPDSLLDEFNRCNDALARAAFTRSRLIRLPYGSVPHLTDDMRDALVGQGFRYWDWTVDSKDSAPGATPETILENTIAQLEASTRNVHVILLHDKKLTAEALPGILDYLIEQEYEFRMITEVDQPFNYQADVRTMP